MLFDHFFVLGSIESWLSSSVLFDLKFNHFGLFSKLIFCHSVLFDLEFNHFHIFLDDDFFTFSQSILLPNVNQMSHLCSPHK